VELKSKFLNSIAIAAEKYRNVFIIFLFSAQLVRGIACNIKDWRLKYSAAKETAQFIKNKHMENMVIIGSPDNFVSPIAGYLNKNIYYPEEGRFGSYCLWNKKRLEKIGPDEIIRVANEIKSRDQKDILLILNYKLESRNMTSQLRIIKEFTNSMVQDEIYYLYLLPYRESGFGEILLNGAEEGS
jgi:hypothetical protein